MDYGLIGKLEMKKRAKRLLDEKHHFRFTKLEIMFENDEIIHTITFENNDFKCSCNVFQKGKGCEHTLALQELLEGTINIFNDNPVDNPIERLPGDSTTEAPRPDKKKIKT